MPISPLIPKQCQLCYCHVEGTRSRKNCFPAWKRFDHTRENSKSKTQNLSRVDSIPTNLLNGPQKGFCPTTGRRGEIDWNFRKCGCWGYIIRPAFRYGNSLGEWCKWCSVIKLSLISAREGRLIVSKVSSRAAGVRYGSQNLVSKYVNHVPHSSFHFSCVVCVRCRSQFASIIDVQSCQVSLCQVCSFQPQCRVYLKSITPWSYSSIQFENEIVPKNPTDGFFGT